MSSTLIPEDAYVVEVNVRFLVDAVDEDAALDAALTACDIRDSYTFLSEPELSVEYVGALSDNG